MLLQGIILIVIIVTINFQHAMAFRGPLGTSYAFDVNKRINAYRVQKLNQQDLDRNFCLATANLFKWMQAARMELPWMQAGYRAFGLLAPAMTRRLLVGSQVITLVKAGALSEAVDREVTTFVEVGDVGQKAIEFRYRIFFDSELVATASTVMIVVAGTPGHFKSSAAVPEDVRALGSKEKGKDHMLMKETFKSLAKEAPSDAYAAEVVVRYSDEDVNKHANHAAQARFLEDVKELISHDEVASASLRAISQQHLEAIMISYTPFEVSAMDHLTVKVSSSIAGALDVWVYRTHANPVLVARGRMICGGGKLESSDERRLRSSKLELSGPQRDLERFVK